MDDGTCPTGCISPYYSCFMGCGSSSATWSYSDCSASCGTYVQMILDNCYADPEFDSTCIGDADNTLSDCNSQCASYEEQHSA